MSWCCRLHTLQPARPPASKVICKSTSNKARLYLSCRVFGIFNHPASIHHASFAPSRYESPECQTTATNNAVWLRWLRQSYRHHQSRQRASALPVTYPPILTRPDMHCVRLTTTMPRELASFSSCKTLLFCGAFAYAIRAQNRALPADAESYVLPRRKSPSKSSLRLSAAA